MKKIYIAGPYDGKNVIEVLGNIRRGLQMARTLMGLGFAVFCPFLDFLIAFMGEDLPIEMYRANSLEWVKACDAVILLPGWENSGGVKAEIDLALNLRVPVFDNVEMLVDWSRGG